MTAVVHSHHRDELESLLDEELGFDATTSNGLTNHLPMALVAKDALGASNEELRRYAGLYRRRLVPRLKTNAALTRDNWRGAIGREGSYEDLRVYFTQAISDQGVDATIRGHLDATIPGICGGAFHGAIRLAYALELASPARIAAGLAYLAECATPLAEPISFDPSGQSVGDVLEQLSSHREFDSLPGRALISEEMSQVASVTAFRQSIARARVGRHTMDELRAAALTLYATTGDFTSLHAVTGVEALTSIRPFVWDQEAFDATCLTGVAAAYATIGAPKIASLDWLQEFSARSVATPQRIAEVGARSDDEHDSKLIYSALRLHASTKDDLYLAVAGRRAGLFDEKSAPADG